MNLFRAFSLVLSRNIFWANTVETSTTVKVGKHFLLPSFHASSKADISNPFLCRSGDILWLNSRDFLAESSDTTLKLLSFLLKIREGSKILS